MKLFSTKKFAELADVSVITLKRWRKSGKLTPILVDGNGKFFYSEKQLEGVSTLGQKFSQGYQLSKICLELPIFGVSTSLTSISVSETFKNQEVISMKLFDDFFNFVKLGKPKPVKNLVIPIDTVSKAAFNPTYTTGKRKVQECKNPKLFSYLSVESLDSLPGAFDELIYRAVISEIQAGREFITPTMLYRDIGGSPDNDVSQAWKDKILNSVKKLARSWISYKIPVDLFQKLHYEIPDKFKEIDDFVCFEGHILDCRFISLLHGDNIIDGAFKVIDTPPLFEIAEKKGQIITTDISLLHVPKLKVTKNTLVLKNYIIEYVLSVIGSRSHKKFITVGRGNNKRRFNRVTQLNQAILLDTLFAECGLQNLDRFQQRECRTNIKKIMNHLLNLNVINDWHFRKDGKTFSAIEFSI